MLPGNGALLRLHSGARSGSRVATCIVPSHAPSRQPSSSPLPARTYSSNKSSVHTCYLTLSLIYNCFCLSFRSVHRISSSFCSRGKLYQATSSILRWTKRQPEARGRGTLESTCSMRITALPWNTPRTEEYANLRQSLPDDSTSSSRLALAMLPELSRPQELL